MASADLAVVPDFGGCHFGDLDRAVTTGILRLTVTGVGGNQASLDATTDGEYIIIEENCGTAMWLLMTMECWNFWKDV